MTNNSNMKPVNGIQSWIETYSEFLELVTVHIGKGNTSYNVIKPVTEIQQVQYDHGHLEVYSTVMNWTNEFEKMYIGNDWIETDWLETVLDFGSNKVQSS